MSPLVSLLKDEKGGADGLTTGYEAGLVRAACVRALGQIGDPQAVDALVEAIRTTSPQAAVFRAAAVEALGKIGDRRGVDPLLESLSDTDTDWVASVLAIKALAKIGDARALGRLLELAFTDEGDVRKAAEEAVLAFGPTAVARLIPLVKDASSNYRLSAAWLLGDLRAREAVEPLITILKDGIKNDNWWMRLVAATALFKIPDARAIQPLMAVVEDANERVRDQAFQALWRIGDTFKIAEKIAIVSVRWMASADTPCIWAEDMDGKLVDLHDVSRPTLLLVDRDALRHVKEDVRIWTRVKNPEVTFDETNKSAMAKERSGPLLAEHLATHLKAMLADLRPGEFRVEAVESYEALRAMIFLKLRSMTQEKSGTDSGS